MRGMPLAETVMAWDAPVRYAFYVSRATMPGVRAFMPPQGLLLSYGLRVEPVLAEDAEAAARLWRAGSGLSLADRLCLATAQRLGATVWTADGAWGASERVRQIR